MLTQPGPSAWRPSTRASVVSSPVTTASRRSGPSHFDTERTTAQRSRPVDQRVPRRAGHRPEVVVLDHEHVVGQHRAQLLRTGGVERGAARVVAARRDHHGARLRGGERVGEHPALVDGHGDEPQAERARQVEHAGPARVLDGDGVAGREVGGEDALDRVERAVERAHARRRHAVGRRKPPWRASASSGSTGSAPYSRCGASMSRSAAAEVGSSAGSGLPVARSRAPAGTAASSNRERTGGRSATRSPLRGRETTTPRRRRSATAAATVAVLTPSAPAMRRTDGSASPGSSFAGRDVGLHVGRDLARATSPAADTV